MSNEGRRAGTHSGDMEILQKEAPVRLGVLDGFIGFYLRLAYEESFNDFSRILGSDSLKPGSFALMSLIFENPGITQVEIGRANRRDKSSVTTALRQLEDAGLIRRVRLEDDRRSYAAYVTEEGAVVYERIAAKARTHIQKLDDIVGPERKPVLLSILQDIIDELAKE